MGQIPTNRKIKIIQRNKRAYNDFEILQKFEAGIVLTGSEVKALRQGKCSIQDAYCLPEQKSTKDKFCKDPFALEMNIINLHIGKYDQSSEQYHYPRRERKLLLHKEEIIRLKSAIEQKGLALIPLSIYFSGPFVKLELALVKAKKKYDKREEIKKKDLQKQISRNVKL